ncbi:hypothetical protein [Desulfococcus multivorans]|uniref:hypothetical protein n=2 Tax=Desulfococcus multivorans TaxID=897 RepID=UPI00146F8D9C|nr:hypothetical protein [Desulfococcus multivorans]
MQRRIQSVLTVTIQEPLFKAGRTPFLDLLEKMVPDVRLDWEDGASDARFLSAHGIPGVVWGADGDQSQHSDDEHVAVESITRLYGALDQFLDACRNMPSPERPQPKTRS